MERDQPGSEKLWKKITSQLTLGWQVQLKRRHLKKIFYAKLILGANLPFGG